MAESSQRNNQDQDWWFAQSGEYVLGTLPEDEHQVFHKILEHDFDAQMYVSAWLQQLQPMTDGVRPMNPPAEVWQNLQSNLMMNANPNSGNGDQSMLYEGDASRVRAGAEYSHESEYSLSKFAKSLFRARQWATVATIAAAALALVLLSSFLNKSPTASSDNFDGVAVLGNDSNDKIFTVDTASAAKQIRVTSFNPPALPEGKMYQLWAVNNDAGIESLALIGDEPDSWIISDVDASLDDAVAIKVSVEPAAGSSVTGPTGRVVFQGALE